ncbi:indoleamine 2,3-dioxygenase [Aspergillus sclerotialis]|uniref:Indoleamine 2,3-dioxygenase n=1 Tax=Aspergillus sclerotialis TaxID=2070753 RepID=A0A3A2ZBZ2_9EURO|nr:indoleamine 2,3-dioxygenase [Aspergillus sclerotialis]
MPHSQESILIRYAVSVKHGFLPGSAPLQKLEDPYYEPWEQIASNLPKYIQTESIKQVVDSLPILSTSNLHSEEEWRRAYVVLAYLTHAYIWGGEQPKEKLPPCISSPFLEVSAHLELPPCATYAAVCLWNYSFNSTATDLAEPDNLTVNTSFTGTKDEEWFFMVSISIEEIGAKLIPLMLNTFDAVDSNDSQRVSSLLSKVADGINDVTHVLGRMIEKCAPAVFFHQVRPFLAGSKNMAAAGLPNGVFYDRGDGFGEWHQYFGGSNAQSSLIQAFDIFLGVEHSATGDSASQASAKTGYLHSMRYYMPGPHHRFLDFLTKISNLRPYVMAHSPNSAVRTAYNAAVEALTSLRDKHMQLVARYILLAAKVQPGNSTNGRVNLATATTKIKENDASADNAQYHGTGGTKLMPFLKQTRDATRAAAGVVDQ